MYRYNVECSALGQDELVFNCFLQVSTSPKYGSFICHLSKCIIYYVRLLRVSVLALRYEGLDAYQIPVGVV